MVAWHAIPLDPLNPEQIDWIVALWNRAGDDELPFSAEFVRYNTDPCRPGRAAGRIALDSQRRPIGYVLASHFPQAPAPMDPQLGWIDAIAVTPPLQRQGIGSWLLGWAERWLAECGCTQARIGASLRIFLPGVPCAWQSAGFFHRHGYVSDRDGGQVWDVARNLNDYTSPPQVANLPCAVRPAQPGQAGPLLDFLAQEFPGRWHFECQDFLNEGGRLSDYMLLWTEQGLQGACRLTLEDSIRPMERFYPYGLPRPWGQLGSIGIAGKARGRGFGLALLDGGLRRLHDNGVNGCVIDWTTLLDFYAKVGFEPYHCYQQMRKTLSAVD